MERERLTQLLEDPARLTRQDLADLAAMAERYPWFSGAQLLRAAGERAGGEVLSDETLRKASVHVPSRSVLFDLTNNALPKPKAPMRVVRTEDLPAAQEKPASNVVAPTPPVEPVIPAPEPVQQVPVIEPAPPVAQTTAPPRPDTVDELDLQILESAASGAYDLTILEQIPEAAPPSKKPSTPAWPAASAPSNATPAVDRNARLSFFEWLDASEGSAVPSAEPVPPTPAVQPESGPLDTAALIDRFIRHETPEPRKTAFFTPQQAGKRSLDDSAGLVTETLARIYARQGNTAKAIEAYRRLALRYPEKSAYFAALSKDLESPQNP